MAKAPPSRRTPHRGWFTRFASRASQIAGHPITSLSAVGVIMVWAICGPIFGYSDTWQLIINTSTTIITFLMVFLIQNTQNRDSKAVHLKLDELIRATEGAYTALLDLEELDESHLKKICNHYEKIAEVARQRLAEGKKDTNIPKVILNRAI